MHSTSARGLELTPGNVVWWIYLIWTERVQTKRSSMLRPSSVNGTPNTSQKRPTAWNYIQIHRPQFYP